MLHVGIYRKLSVPSFDYEIVQANRLPPVACSRMDVWLGGMTFLMVLHEKTGSMMMQEVKSASGVPPDF